MKIFLVAILIIFLYLRKPVSRLWRNTKINYLLGLYNSYKHANGHDEKALAFEQIAKNRPLSNDLIGGLYFFSPSYDDFGNEEKIRDAYIRLCEAFDDNYYWAKKYLHPKYLIKDIFFLPGAILGFLFNREFNNVPSFLVSCLTWTATILISAYATELRQLIDAVIKNFS
ncbi:MULTISPECIES: hypothetical protein [Lysinibacillus]|uniref:Tetratricopeptide repeat protein n=1 Tax=Lysinibacillus varians TaxID=1145276 RepID=A0ABY2TCP7_9BACI|nr:MULTISPECIES: hypothetical protein [Lysinibacillus]AHN24376.1 hypothetical protein T479_16425 [Lysinibacillus varians]TKI66079.1 hypothetical protein FC752_05805 [Lysinibacillus varians]WNN77552.1 hypothetical protein RKS58_06835 [Lysinibacillus capsici]